jgi:hypothetical protein
MRSRVGVESEKYLQIGPFRGVRRRTSPCPTRPVTPEVAGSSPVRSRLLNYLQIGTLRCLLRRRSRCSWPNRGPRAPEKRPANSNFVGRLCPVARRNRVTSVALHPRKAPRLVAAGVVATCGARIGLPSSEAARKTARSSRCSAVVVWKGVWKRAGSSGLPPTRRSRHAPPSATSATEPDAKSSDFKCAGW